MQITTKNGRPLIIRETRLPIHSNTVEARIKKIKDQLNEGLSKFDAKWNSIQNDLKLSTIN